MFIWKIILYTHLVTFINYTFYFKLNIWNKTTGDTKNDNVLLIAKNETKIHFLKMLTKQKKMKAHLRHVATCFSFILKA